MNELEGRRIFIVEDDLDHRALAVFILEQHGAETDIDRSGDRVVEKLRRFSPVDLILMDLKLADGRSGFDIAREIRAISQFQSVPIVAVSSSDTYQVIEQARELGFVGLINKPLDGTKFPRQIARILEGESIWGSR